MYLTEAYILNTYTRSSVKANAPHASYILNFGDIISTHISLICYTRILRDHQ